MSKIRCDTCTHWELIYATHPRQGETGHCHCNPPTVITIGGTGSKTVWPCTKDCDRCGAWKCREAANA
jgi:hypothetical protein